MSTTSTDVSSTLSLPPEERAAALVALGRGALKGEPGIDGAQLVQALVNLVEEGVGDSRVRLAVGEVLGLLGDPRISSPESADYWIAVTSQDGNIQIGRFPVTNAEFKKFVDDGGYQDRSLWTDEGWAWLQDCKDPWPVRVRSGEHQEFVVDNQPVVGVTWYEAVAYAAKHRARLPTFDERLWVIRGEEKRPYPWGSPFGTGNANTREEVLNRPCAVGLFVRDATPEGVRDLAGNVAEWNQDGFGDHPLIHPGAWNQPSMASWAKARDPRSPDSRTGGLGFRLVRSA